MCVACVWGVCGCECECVCVVCVSDKKSWSSKDQHMEQYVRNTLTHLLTPCSRVLIQKLTGSQLV